MDLTEQWPSGSDGPVVGMADGPGEASEVLWDLLDLVVVEQKDLELLQRPNP